MPTTTGHHADIPGPAAETRLMGRVRVHPLRTALLLSAGYAATVIVWMLAAVMLYGDKLAPMGEDAPLVIANGVLFTLFTTAVLIVIIDRYLNRLRSSEASFAEAQDELRRKDLAVRQGYVDVLDAVTGGKFILLTEDELRATLGDVVLPPRSLGGAKEISDARHEIAGMLEALPGHVDESYLLAVSEALTNAVKHGERGEYAIYRSAMCVQVLVRDFGPGIDFRELPKATLVQGFSTTSTLGMGFTIMLEVCDRVLLTTDANGTVVVLEIEAQATRPAADRTLETILSATIR